MRGPAVQPIVIAAGGTGGHVFPAEALATVLVSRGHRIVLMTDARSSGLRSAVFAGRESFVIAGAGLAGRGARAIGAAAGLIRGAVQARSILRRLDAAAVVGFGGYPSVAPFVAARTVRRRPALLLHEQNAVLGRANRALARGADLLALSFAETTRLPAGVPTRVVGNPVRPAIAARDYTPPTTDIRLLILGGSLGARVFSNVVPAALAALPDTSRLRVTQQCRAEDLGRVRDVYAQCGIAAELAPFFDDVAERLAAAHLVIARAGASTVAELAAMGRPAILVPLPHAIDDHQTANARALGAGAWVVAQPEFTAARLSAMLTRLLGDPGALADAANAARSHARDNAADALADAVEQMVAERVR
jgi:UDP-N-acetylglucosamine--N-acetylmuramyl-(pentapeptide) pyrophosphoryl-undecaprenol N-acetylglucosamine transferase